MMNDSGEKPQPTSLKMIAERAGVSLMTASRSIRGIDGVSEAMRTRVLQIAEEMHYVPNQNARALTSSHSNLIGVCFPTLFNDVFASMLSGMERAFRLAGYQTLVQTTDYSLKREKEWIENLISFRPAAIILTGHDHAPNIRGLLQSSKIPVVEIWDVTDNPIDMCVGIDHYQEGLRFAQYIYDLGYRMPAFIGATEKHDTRADQRFSGVQNVFLEKGRELRRIAVSFESDFMGGAEGFEMLASQVPFDIIFCLNDHVAFGCMSQATKMGFRVPEDFGIVGFNDLDLNHVLFKKITTMKTPRELIGKYAAQNILSRLNGVETKQITRLHCELVEGDTVKTKDLN